MRRILFVDDETDVLEGLRDLLRPRRREWRMDFAICGAAALDLLAEHDYDVVVSDMRMPGIDGATLLAEVQQRQPSAIRIVLSGHAEADAMARGITVAHRFVAKPCDAAGLASIIERSLALGALTESEELRRAAVRATELPHVPDTYLRLAALLRGGEASIAQATAIVERDMATCGRVLQLANSAFFGRARPIRDVQEAVSYLGLRTLSALTLAGGAIAALRPSRETPGFSIEAVQAHGARVARVAPGLLDDPRFHDDTVAAAMLLDIGLLVLAAEEPDYLAEVIRAAATEDRTVAEIEYERRGISHAEIGAHLLALWGLPHQMVEAVAFHHRPSAAAPGVVDAVAAVHIASALVSEHETGEPLDALLAPAYLATLGVEERLPAWRRDAALALGGAPV